jgi:Cys-tRNA(Pro)/Cys-tRNA(Cys) deacylase
MAKNNDKTNVMRLLDAKKISYGEYSYSPEEAVSAEEVAAVLHQTPERVFKTLVTVAKSGQHYVFVIPGPAELDLKKAAAAAGEKAIEMLKSKDLLGLTGYIHGGCSPIGMKKFFRTFVHRTAEDFPTIFISAGRRGSQVEISPDDLARMIRLDYADLIRQ